MVQQLWETVKESITAYTGLSPATFFTALAVGLALYYVVSNLFSSSDDGQSHHGGGFEEQMQPLPPPVQVGEITEEELKQYDGSDSKKPLLMAIKGQIYDVSQSRMFYGPGGPYALFAGKDASRALAKMSFEDKDLNGDLTGLGVFELEALQDWEYKFMSKYVKVGTVKTTVHVNDGAAESQAREATETEAAKPAEVVNGNVSKPTEPAEAADRDVAKPAEDGPSETAAKEKTEETTTADDAEKKE
ncbi:putative steroid membrane receptor Hpr6.6/25-Dx [Handroanthus impetiginosus]|uniref:Putative steroid membrane receptor Hpr6.6/25-Dx n=1 Tax=Handroanthus impetiginosus TaxID=429701 RepID=A0A2G9H0F0_9LAMI|nr:putative steroid membrane receptor Hpr6.6/25-Dx [Handroanthus impetiginosus]